MSPLFEVELESEPVAARLWLRGLGSRAVVLMLSRPTTGVGREIFRFKGCLRTRRSLATSSRRSSPAVAPATREDLDLVTLFDHPQDTYPVSFQAHTGLFGHRFLTTPHAFHTLLESTLPRAQLLVNRLLRARESRDELRQAVRNFDRLSNLLCSVIDLTELLRQVHPDWSWRAGAVELHEKMNEFMNVLNTEVGLYEVLDIVLNDPSISSTMNEETLDTAHLFWRDFQKSGIHLPRKQRDRFVSLSSEILELGWQFQANGGTAEPARILLSELEGLKDHGLGARLKQRVKFASRELLIYPGSLQAQMIMRSAPSEDVRRKVYIACNSSPPERIAILEQLLRARGELARLVGKDSYAQMALEHTMAGTPENVTNFLGALVANNRPRAHDALRALSMRKQTHLGTASLPTIQAWDRDYYCPPEPAAPPISLPPLTPGTVFMGLSRLFRHLYGISLRPAEIAPGEVWHTDVRKLEVVDENMGVLGWLYADLFSREGKGSGSAHYTIRCARRVDKDDIAGDLHFGYHPNVVGYETLAGTSIEFEGAHRRQLSGKPGIYQLPVIALVCDFARPSAHRGAAAMEWQEVKTLYHEMGHAMHSMIGQTEYHNVAGTRCTTDFVELPSILMEHFLESETVLSLFDKTDGSHTRQVGNHHEDPCRSIDTHWQIMLAAMDQVYHSSDVLDPGFDSTVALARLHDEQGVIPFVPGTSSQTQFGHLYSYGATYYSYAFDRAIASRVWRQVFANDPLSRETGEKYKRDILRHGAVGNPWHLVANLLDAPELAMGKAEAMREVGSWRIEDDVTIAGTH